MQPTAPYVLYVVPYLRIFIVKALLYVFKAWGTTHKVNDLHHQTGIVSWYGERLNSNRLDRVVRKNSAGK